MKAKIGTTIIEKTKKAMQNLHELFIFADFFARQWLGICHVGRMVMRLLSTQKHEFWVSASSGKGRVGAAGRVFNGGMKLAQSQGDKLETQGMGGD